MSEIPRDKRFDATMALARDPYRFIASTAMELGSDVFVARLVGREVVCMTGPDAAELLCDEHRFIRAGAALPALQKTLFGIGGVQGLDDDEHRHRKKMFTSVIGPDEVQQMTRTWVGTWWEIYADAWSGSDEVDLYPEVCRLLTQAICHWSGVPLEPEEVDQRARQLTALFNDAGSKGPRHFVSRLARRRAERWMQALVQNIRSGKTKLPERSPAHIFATYRDLSGHLLDTRIAAVELLNLLRPTVAVAVYIVFLVDALQKNAQWRERIARDDRSVEAFVHEVRRFYPFFPSIMAIVRRDFEWRGLHLATGTRVLLDVYGTNHDPRCWVNPDRFDPTRFIDATPDHRFALIPQGPGDHFGGHRCAGEWLTIELMKLAVRFFVTRISYKVEGWGEINMMRLPALPRRPLRLSSVRFSG